MQDTKELIRVMQAYIDGRKVLVKRGDGSIVGIYEYANNGDLSWFPNYEYSIVLGRPDSIDWSHVARKYNYLARDADGEPWLYSDRPTRRGASFGGEGECIRATYFASYKNNGADWDESMSSRIIMDTSGSTVRVDGIDIKEASE